MWLEVALGQLQLSVAAVIVLHCLRVVKETEETVYSQDCQAPRSTTGESYKDMTNLVYSMKDPAASRGSNHQSTANYLKPTDRLLYDPNFKWRPVEDLHQYFQDLLRLGSKVGRTFLRSEIDKLFSEVNAGSLNVPVVSIIIRHCIRLIGQFETKVYDQFPRVYAPTGKPYDDMAAVLYDMMEPKTGSTTDHQETAEYSEQEFVFLGVGRSLRKLTQVEHSTKQFEWPPPLPEARMYVMSNRDFILSRSFETFDREDGYLSQFGMDIHLGEILVRDSYVEKEATRLSHTPLQAVMAEVWKSKVTTVQSVFAALITLDFQRVVDKPTSHLSAAQKGCLRREKEGLRGELILPIFAKG
ncbi:hypothetical protein PG991_010949 [Apiospora marii]|uniref:Cullin N-terminal domain-containing protein n=1 Tax=Apiospora marii TaxID=335849 RepID=A0ABR1RCV4_9PEZI